MTLRTLCVGLAVVSLCSLAAGETLSPLFNPATMMASADVKPGMKAVGKSVFSGVTITEFNLEVMAVMEKANNGGDMVVARVLDGPVVERKSGVMGGMSGSPVYIAGKLVGAVAWTWPYEKEPVAGITPINDMLTSLDKPQHQADASPLSGVRARYASARGAFAAGGRQVSAVEVMPRPCAPGAFADAHTMVMCPVAPPIYCAGLSAAAMARLGKALKPFGMEPVAGPGAKRDPVDVELEPGAAFGIPLVSGDFDISTGGTVTYRDGDLLLGFGHPFMEMGKTSLPLSTSWVDGFIPRIDRTDKMMSPMKTVGTITQDRPWSVGGIVGPPAPMVPATFKITDETRDFTKTYHVEVIHSRDMAGEMLASAAMSALSATYSASGEGMVRVKVTVRGTAGNTMTRQDSYYHEGDPTGPGLSAMMEACSALTINRFKPQEVASVDYEATLSPKDNTAAIEGIYCDAGIAKAGEPLKLRIRLRPDASDTVVEKTVTLQMPVTLETGTLRIAACPGSEAMRNRIRVGVMPPVMYSLEDFIKVYEGIEQGNQLFVVAGLPGRNMAVGATTLPGLPRVARSLLQDGARTDVTQGGGEIAVTQDMPFVLYGSAGVGVPTEDRLGRKGKATPGGSKPPSDGPGGPPDGIAAGLPAGVPASLWWAAAAFVAPARMAGKRAPDGPGLAQTPDDGEDDAPGDEPKKDDKTPPKPVPPADEGKKGPKADEAKPDKTKTEEAKTEPEAKTEGAVAREPLVWAQTTAEDFKGGTAHGVAVRSDGGLELAPGWSTTASDEPFIWCLAAGATGAYSGAADSGKVYRLDGAERKLWFDTKAFGVSAMLGEAEGSLLVASFPGGQVFRVTGEGQGKELCRLDGKYVWDMVADGAKGYYLATGPDAAVMHLAADGTVEKTVDLRQGHATKLLMRDGRLYIGTSENGAVYRMEADKRLVSVYDAGKSDISAMAAGPDGSVAVGTAPEGNVVAIKPDGSVTTLLQGAGGGVMSLASLNGQLVAGLGDGGMIVQILDAQTSCELRNDSQGSITGLCVSGSRLYAANSNPGQVLTADLADATRGDLVSAVFDAKGQSRWGRASWGAQAPAGTQTMLWVRSGNSADPDDGSWSAWAQVAEPGRDRAEVPGSHFLQYKVEMTKSSGSQTPRVDWVRFAYLPANHEPTVKDVKPAEGNSVHGKVKLTWKMEDPDKDKLEAKLLARLKGKLDYTIVKEGITASEYEWDTKSMDDGVYDLRLVVDDGLANPTDARDATADVRAVTIDNRPPEVVITSGPAEQPSGEIAIAGFAVDETSRIANIAWQVKGGDMWRAARLDDGMYDWKYERFLIVAPPQPEDVKELVIRTRDAAGNVTDTTVTLPGKETKPAAKPASAPG